MDLRGFAETLVILVIVNSLETSCTCPACPTKVHPQDAYCNGDFVIKASITDMTMVGDDPETPEDDPTTQYSISIDKVFKEPPVPTVEATCVVESLASNATAGCFFTLITLKEPQPCGVELNVDETYLISGFEEDGKLKIDECGLNIPWDEVTPHMKIGLNKRYEKNCQCPTGEGKCVADPASADICFCRYATCVEVQKEGCAPECKWFKSRSLKQCVEDN
ncbi:metalloproteinase inhibitor 2-like [Ylistrum balloti]|uniref:metalloproteinase inhibitor 2-like n=1 Tax=Ylistrum balloti TaxID=509963 RepID=UPI002905DD9D|nr:metalloproteinase inhibitor 2-like [Ylistrum balloti]